MISGFIGAAPVIACLQFEKPAFFRMAFLKILLSKGIFSPIRTIALDSMAAFTLE